jgi:hypothetical protein
VAINDARPHLWAPAVTVNRAPARLRGLVASPMGQLRLVGKTGRVARNRRRCKRLQQHDAALRMHLVELFEDQ